MLISANIHTYIHTYFIESDKVPHGTIKCLIIQKYMFYLKYIYICRLYKVIYRCLKNAVIEVCCFFDASIPLFAVNAPEFSSMLTTVLPGGGGSPVGAEAPSEEEGNGVIEFVKLDIDLLI